MSSASPDPRRLTNFPAFDGFRGIGVLIVLLSHFPQVLDNELYNLIWQINQGPRLGYICLDIFFAISGFFITRLLLREQEATGTISFSKFYYRRALRIFPVYYFTAFVCYFVFHFGVADSLSLLTYTFNIYHPFHPAPHPLEHTWSLSVEEQFYFIWPLLILLVPRRLTSVITGKVVPVLAIVSGLIIALAFGIQDNLMAGDLVYMSLVTRMLSLSLGGWLAVREFENRPLRGWPCLLLLIVAIVLQFIDRKARDLGIMTSQPLYWTIALAAYAMISVAFTSTIVFDRGIVGRGLTAALSLAPLRWIGAMSYAIYVVHLPVLFYMGLNDGALNGAKVPIAQVAIALAVSMAFAIISYFVIERPLQSLRHKSQPKPLPSGVAVPGQ